MATTNPNVDAIVGYVDQQRVPLIGKSVLGAKAPQYFNLMTGVKGTTALNIIDADPALQCGNACGFNSLSLIFAFCITSLREPFVRSQSSSTVSSHSFRICGSSFFVMAEPIRRNAILSGSEISQIGSINLPLILPNSLSPSGKICIAS